MAKILTVTLSALQVFHGWLKKLCGSVHLLGLWPSSETENIQLQKAHMAMVSSLSCVLRHFWSRFLGHSKSHVIMCFPLLRQLPAESRQVLVRHFPSAFFQILQLNFFIFPWGFHSPPVASCYFIMRNSSNSYFLCSCQMVLMPNACLIQGRQTIHASSAVSLKDFTTASGGSRVSPKPMVSRTMRFPSWDVTALYVVYHVYIYIYTYI